jgi:hypothetical protein
MVCAGFPYEILYQSKALPARAGFCVPLWYDAGICLQSTNSFFEVGPASPAYFFSVDWRGFRLLFETLLTPCFPLHLRPNGFVSKPRLSRNQVLAGIVVALEARSRVGRTFCAEPLFLWF